MDQGCWLVSSQWWGQSSWVCVQKTRRKTGVSSSKSTLNGDRTAFRSGRSFFENYRDCWVLVKDLRVTTKLISYSTGVTFSKVLPRGRLTSTNITITNPRLLYLVWKRCAVKKTVLIWGFCWLFRLEHANDVVRQAIIRGFIDRHLVIV